MLGLEKIGRGRDEIVPFSYLVGGYGGNGLGLSPEVHSGRIRGNGHELQQEEFQLDIGEKTFTVRASKHHNRELVRSLSLELPKTQWDEAVTFNVAWKLALF